MQMKEEVSSMVSNFSKLIKTSKVGHTEQVAAYQGDSETTERPVPIETQSYMDLRVSVPIQNFASSIAANGLVRSSESLLSLINVLKINRVLDDPARIQTDKKSTRPLTHTCTRIFYHLAFFRIMHTDLDRYTHKDM